MRPAVLISVIFCAFPASAQEDIPALNQKIVAFCDAKMGTKVGRGEPYDLATFSLSYAGADWDPLYKFGKKVYWRSQTIYPGDIIFMWNVTLERNGEKLKAEEYTAIVHEVKAKGAYIIAEQNWGKGQGVNLVELDMKTFRGGLQFFRPKEPPPPPKEPPPQPKVPPPPPPPEE